MPVSSHLVADARRALLVVRRLHLDEDKWQRVAALVDSLDQALKASDEASFSAALAELELVGSVPRVAPMSSPSADEVLRPASNAELEHINKLVPTLDAFPTRRAGSDESEREG